MQESLLLPFIFNTVLEVLDITISQKKKKKKKSLHIGREEIKLSLFVNDMILYIEIIKGSQEKTPQTNK